MLGLVIGFRLYARSCLFFTAAWYRYGVIEDASTKVAFLCQPKSALGTVSRSSHVAAGVYFILFGREPLSRMDVQ